MYLVNLRCVFLRPSFLHQKSRTYDSTNIPFISVPVHSPIFPVCHSLLGTLPHLDSFPSRMANQTRFAAECIPSLPPTAARSLGISLNKLKRACRQYGIPRWPYRQVRSIRSTIQSLEKALEKCDSEIETASLKERLASLIKKESLVCKFASCGENRTRSVTLFDRFTH